MKRLLTLGLLLALAACDRPKPAASAPPPPPPAPDEGTGRFVKGPDPRTPVQPDPTPKAQDTRPPAPKPDLLPDMQEYVVKPIEGEPAWPSPSEEKEVAQRGYIPFKGGYIYELTDDKGKITQSGIVVDGTILLDRGVIELLGCGAGGKEYESVLRLESDVQALDLALSLLGLKRGPIPGRLNDPDLVQGSRVLVLLQWADEKGAIVTHRAEDCIVNIQRKAPMPRVGWTYVGAMLPVPDPAATGGKTYRVLAAAGTRSLLTTYRDPSTLLDNPLFDAIDDSLYIANYMVLPPSGTKVRVILRPPEESVKKDIAKIEEELSK